MRKQISSLRLQSYSSGKEFWQMRLQALSSTSGYRRSQVSTRWDVGFSWRSETPIQKHKAKGKLLEDANLILTLHGPITYSSLQYEPTLEISFLTKLEISTVFWYQIVKLVISIESLFETRSCDVWPCAGGHHYGGIASKAGVKSA